MRITGTIVLLLLMLLLTLALPAAQAEVGLLSGRDISLVGDWTYEPLPTNEIYHTLIFRFTCAEDPTVYEACIAGITLEPVDGELEACIEPLLLSVADCFYGDEPMFFTSEEKFTEEYGLSFQTIDAEKVHIFDSYGENSDLLLPDTDSMLCWAGSTSNMLAFSGWGAASGNEAFTGEDALFDLFEHAFTDAGAAQTDGVKWFFNGVFPLQQTDEAGAVINGYENADIDDAQEKWEEDDKRDGELALYAAEAISRRYDGIEDGYDPLMAALLKLKEGCAVGFDIHFYADGSRTEAGAHALTFMGYIRDTDLEGGDALCAVFYSDSDNDKTDDAVRTEMPNSLWMMNVTPATVTLYGDKQVTYLAMPGTAGLYSDDGENVAQSVAHITGYHVLEACNETSAELALEKEGSMEPTVNVDYVVEACSIQDKKGSNLRTVSVGDKLLIYVQLTNHSYTMLDLSEQPYVMLTYTLTCDEEVTAMRTVQLWFDTGDATDQAPTKTYKFKVPASVVPQTPGQYGVSIQIDGLYTGDGEPIAEAYTANNTSAEYVFTVEGTATGEETELFSEETEVIRTARLAVTFRQHSAESYEITIPGQEADGLALMQESELIGTDVCEIVSRGDDTVLCFAPEFIDTTYDGLHPYVLQDADGAEIAWIDLQVADE